MAVVSKENKIIGIITIDDVVDIIVEEASEDTALLNQVRNEAFEKVYEKAKSGPKAAFAL